MEWLILLNEKSVFVLHAYNVNAKTIANVIPHAYQTIAYPQYIAINMQKVVRVNPKKTIYNNKII